MVNRPHFVISVFAFALSSLVLSTTTHAQERRITRNQLPIAVRKAADEQAQGATVRGYTTEIENGQREYEIELTINGHSRDVAIAPDGRIIETEDQVTAENLPAVVISALRSKAHEGEIRKIESITKNGAIVAYEAQVWTASRHFEIQVGPDGESLTREE